MKNLFRIFTVSVMLLICTLALAVLTGAVEIDCHVYTPGQLLEIAGKYNGGSVGKMAYSLTEDGLLRIKPTSTTGDNKAFALFEFLPGSIGSIDTNTGAIGGTSNIASDFNAKDYPYMAISYRNKFTNGNTASPYILIRPAVYDSVNGKYVVVYKPGNALVDGYGYTYSESIHKSIVNTTELTDAWQNRVSGFSWNNVAADSGVGYLEMKLLNGTFDINNDYMDIEYIGFFKTVEDAQAYVYGDTPPAPETKYTVTFKNKDGGVISSTDYDENADVTLPSAPAVEGMEFVAWVNEADDTQVTSSFKATADITLIASYKAVETDPSAKGNLRVYTAEELIKMSRANHMTASLYTDGDNEYVRIVPSSAVTGSNDNGNTYPLFNFYDAVSGTPEFKASEYPYMAMGYRTNITYGNGTASGKPENYAQPFYGVKFADGKYGRVWKAGDYSTSSSDGMIKLVGGISNITNTDGYGSLTGITDEKIDPDTGVQFLRLRLRNGTAWTADDYMDIQYISFFGTLEEAQNYKFSVCTATFKDIDGGTLQTSEFISGTAFDIPKAPSVFGKRFLRWESEAGDVVDSSYRTTSSVTIVPVYEDATSYSVVYYVEGEIYHQETVDVGAELIFPTSPKNQFKGWYYEDGTKAEEGIKVGADIVLYAQFGEEKGSSSLKTLITILKLMEVKKSDDVKSDVKEDEAANTEGSSETDEGVSDYHIYEAEELISMAAQNRLNYELYTDKGLTVVRATPKADTVGAQNDQIYARFNFMQSGAEPTFKIKEYPIVVIGYRSNVKESTPYLQPFYGLKVRETGTYLRCWKAGQYVVSPVNNAANIHNVITDVSAIGNRDGVVVSIHDIADDSGIEFMNIRFKKTDVYEAGDFLDIQYIAFFKTAKDAQAFQYGK